MAFVALSLFFFVGRSLQSSTHLSSPDWKSLNSSLGGRLAIGTPWSKPCFSTFDGQPASPNNKECQHVQENYSNHPIRSDAFGGYMATQFESCMSSGDQCELDFLNPPNPAAYTPPAQCSQGSVPSYYISVETPYDVVAALKFTNATGVPLVIKNTGHDFQGRASAPGSLALWMHNLKDISYNENFISEGCADVTPTPAITVGAGQQFEELFKYVNERGLEVVGGSDQSVGAAGGWLMGGGHSVLSPTLGLGVDRVLQYKLVTPDGVHRVANSCQNKDLFFALRGGGGATFGVVLEATMMVSPSRSYRVANINWDITPENLAQVIKVFVDNATAFASQGWGGYLTPTIGNLILLTPILNLAEAEESMATLLELTSTMGQKSSVSEVDNFNDWFGAYVQGTSGMQDMVGLPVAMSSRLMPVANHATPAGRAEVVTALLSAMGNAFFPQIHFTSPYGSKLTGQGTSVIPAWRSTLYHVILVNTWLHSATLSDRENAYAQSATAANYLRDITPTSGAYHNEADIYEPNWQDSFWGSNYDTLVDIKKTYDPDHLLDCWHCVNWKGPAEPRYKCYGTNATFDTDFIGAQWVAGV